MLNSCRGGGEQSKSELCKLHVLCYVQGGNTCLSKKRCGMAIDMQSGAERPVETGL